MTARFHSFRFLLLAIPSLLLLFSSMNLSAQIKPFEVRLNYGPSLPMGQFASHEYKRDSIEYGAYALLGLNFTSEAVWYFLPYLGVGVNYSSSQYRIATYYYLEDKDADDPAASNFNMISGNWNIKSYMGGLVFRYPLTKKINLNLQGFGGIYRSQTPDQYYSANYFGIGNYRWFKSSATSYTYSFQTGAGLNYRLLENVALNLYAEYTYSQAVFYYWDPGFTVRTSEYMKIPLLKVTPGVTITF